MTAASLERDGLPSGILWIASYPKSGNTWVRALLNNLLKILRNEDDGTAHDINQMTDYTLWDISAARYERILGRPHADADRAEIARVRPQVQREIADAVDGLAMVKTHQALVLDRGTPTINFDVTAGAVYIVRNPLDVAVSFAAHMGVGIDYAIEEMATQDLETGMSDKSVYEVYGSWTQHVESWTRTPHRAVHVMRYEDMLDDPRRTFGALARHLLLSPDAAQLDLAIERSSFEQLQSQEAATGYHEKPDSAERFFRAGKAGAWGDVLDRRQVTDLVTAHHSQMARFNYLTPELTSLVPLPAVSANRKE